jgi:hypothetical protein
MLKLKNRPDTDEHGWTPQRLPGGIYCSPRCGCSCTKAAYDTANQKAAELCAQLGDGWRPRVWENGTWHWEVAKGPCADGEDWRAGGVVVRPNHTGGFSAEFRSVENGTGNVTQFFADAKAAEDAIGAARQDARTFISRLEADLAASI